MISERSIFFILLGVLVIAGIGGAIVQTVKQQQKEDSRPSPRLGNACGPATRSWNHIRQCAFPKKGKTFTQDIGNELENAASFVLRSRVPMRGLQALLSSRARREVFGSLRDHFRSPFLTTAAMRLRQASQRLEATPTTRAVRNG